MSTNAKHFINTTQFAFIILLDKSFESHFWPYLMGVTELAYINFETKKPKPKQKQTNSSVHSFVTNKSENICGKQNCNLIKS